MRQEKGITILALIITVILMLILAGVVVTGSINSGLFKTTQDASKNTINEADYDKMLAGGFVEKDGQWVKISEITGGSGGGATGSSNWTETTVTGWSSSVTAMTDGSNTIPVPSGFTISDVDGENSYSNGVIIKDSSENEFVWVPYVNATTYSAGGAGYVEEELAYAEDQEDFQNMINTYNGFWIGRYNTTYDSFNAESDTYSGIGVKKNGTTLDSYVSVYGQNMSSSEWVIEGVNYWQDFYDYQNLSINGVYSKMVSYLMCEMASGVKNVTSLDGVWTQSAVPNDEYESMCFYGTKNKVLADNRVRD